MSDRPNEAHTAGWDTEPRQNPPDQDQLPLPEHPDIPGYEILGTLGRGAMGVVYQARQTALKRVVALKMVLSGDRATREDVARFRREAEAVARFQHPNIVPIYEVGTCDGRPFFSMEFLPGGTLAARLRDRLPEPMAAASLIETLARAMHATHGRGVIHRDLKPANVLLAADGTPKITDFGLAKRLDDDAGQTRSGAIMGTPSYMAPEQAAGEAARVTALADVYALGAVLYECLTGRPPFKAATVHETLRQVVEEEPVPPRVLNRAVPRDLDTICLKCLRKGPGQRYASAAELADDLRRFQAREPIRARPVGAGEKLLKWARRRPAVTALLGGLLVALCVAGVFAWQSHQARERLRAEQRQAAVEKAILEAMGGDAEAALEAIADAENNGAEQGQLNMLRGLVERYRGRPQESLMYLELAERQMPDSVAVKALLVDALLDNGDSQRYDEACERLDRLEPKTFEDHLFLGLAQSTAFDPARGVRTIDGALTRPRQPPVARLARAMAQVSLAQDTGRVEDAERALDDLRKVDLADNPLLVSTRIKALLVAAHAYGATDSRREEALRQAARDADLLGRYPDVPLAVQGRCNYYYVTGDDEALLREARRAYALTGQNGSLWCESAVLARRGRFEEALKVLQSCKGDESAGDRRWAEGGLLAQMGRKAEAEEAFREGLAQYKAGTDLVLRPCDLYLLGSEYRDRVRQISRETRERSSHLIPRYRNGWYHELLAFNAGLIDEARLLEKAGESRFSQCEAYYYIGLSRLADGKRREAKTWFTKSFETGVFLYGEYDWSRQFLKFIDDPKWLPWIPADN
jgi:predicted negative regulator of RcsB-dependent stress response